MQEHRDDVGQGLKLTAIAVVSAVAVASTVIALGQPVLKRLAPDAPKLIASAT
jgi:hypothetical protein